MMSLRVSFIMFLAPSPDSAAFASSRLLFCSVRIPKSLTFQG